MKTYIFVSKNSSITITLNAHSEEEAFEIMDNLVTKECNDFRLSEEEIFELPTLLT